MSETRSEISRRQLLKMASPLGKVTLDKTRCTGCGLCALECPDGALSIAPVKETDAFQLLFKHGLCVACARCVEVCPEKCLRLERTLEPDVLNGQTTVLFQDEIVRCSGCGRPFASKAMIDSIKAKLPATGLPFQFELCPECKIKVQPGRPGK